ncbi:MAG TPA: AprI/Inh family metalloprotease inhibitor [Beijerinckiaceae bacterium]|jgi:hypothetical protein
MKFEETRAAGRLRAGAVACAAAGAATAFWIAAAAAATGGEVAAGRFEMSLDDTNRRCQIILRDEDRAVAMPAGCRRALPILLEVNRWDRVDGGVALIDVTGEPVLKFAAAQTGGYVARGPEGETYALQAGGVQMAQAQTRSGGAGASASPAHAARTSDVAGRYAVLRDEGRDTGCMVTLSENARGRGTYRAQLAPACRDQGIVIFDPISWSIERGKLTLTARKGHKLHLDHAADGSWWKKDGKPIGFRKI